jgi:hypothetical protein
LQFAWEHAPNWNLYLFLSTDRPSSSSGRIPYFSIDQWSADDITTGPFALVVVTALHILSVLHL